MKGGINVVGGVISNPLVWQVAGFALSFFLLRYGYNYLYNSGEKFVDAVKNRDLRFEEDPVGQVVDAGVYPLIRDLIALGPYDPHNVIHFTTEAEAKEIARLLAQLVGKFEYYVIRHYVKNKTIQNLSALKAFMNDLTEASLRHLFTHKEHLLADAEIGKGASTQRYSDTVGQKYQYEQASREHPPLPVVKEFLERVLSVKQDPRALAVLEMMNKSSEKRMFEAGYGKVRDFAHEEAERRAQCLQRPEAARINKELTEKGRLNDLDTLFEEAFYLKGKNGNSCPMLRMRFHDESANLRNACWDLYKAVATPCALQRLGR